MNSTTHLTDFISPEVLAREGFVHTSDSAQMFAKIDKAYLAERGWGDMSVLRSVKISPRQAAEIAGCSASTLKEYIKMGYLAVDDAGQVSLFDAVQFDYPAAKKAYLSTKQRYDNSR